MHWHSRKTRNSILQRKSLRFTLKYRGHPHPCLLSRSPPSSWGHSFQSIMPSGPFGFAFLWAPPKVTSPKTKLDANATSTPTYAADGNIILWITTYSWGVGFDQPLKNSPAYCRANLKAGIDSGSNKGPFNAVVEHPRRSLDSTVPLENIPHTQIINTPSKWSARVPQVPAPSPLV